jgi:transcriptional regulator of acetoin/glycerol metabolism
MIKNGLWYPDDLYTVPTLPVVIESPSFSHKEVERALIIKALENHRHLKAEYVAEIVSMSKTTFYRRLSEYKIGFAKPYVEKGRNSSGNFEPYIIS